MSYRVESYQINPGTSAWTECERLCFKSKNLYNYANYIVRQAFLKKDKSGKYLNNFDLYKLLKSHDCYTSMPAKLAQSVLIQLHQNWKSFFSACKEYKKNPTKFLGPPKPPHYKDKNGRNSVTFNTQVYSKTALRQNLIKLSSLSFLTELRTFEHIDRDGVVTYKFDQNIRDITLIPFNDCYKIIVKYLDMTQKTIIQNNICAGIDLGLNNLAAIATNNQQLPSLLINGRHLKSINQFYNKEKAKLQLKLDTSTSKRGHKRIQEEIHKLTRKRNNKIKHELHQASNMIVNQLSAANVSRLVIGKNDGWKQETNMGKRNNQNFANIPHAKLIEMLRYKWERLGGRFETTEESYTSKCSFLDNEVIGKHTTYMGKRNRRQFVSNLGFEINADINGAANILRKVVNNAWASWSNAELIEGFVVSPPRVTPGESCKTKH